MPLWTSQVVLLAETPPANAGRCKGHGFSPWVRKIPWRRAWQPTSVFLPGESHGQRSLASHSPLGCTELSMTKAAQHIAHSRACLCVYIYHILLIRLSVDRHLGSFHILAIVNNAAVNIGMHIFFELVFLFYFRHVYPRMELLDHMVVLFLVGFFFF